LPPDIIFSYFKAYAQNSISAGAPPQTPLGELTALPRASWTLGVLLLREGKAGKGKGEGEGEERGEEEGKREGGGCVMAFERDGHPLGEHARPASPSPTS